jgi:NAD(P)-dependent dehydrogenase (short-subunit alcohol dehydrogenase family)
MELEGAVCLVTGATSGIGRAAALRFAELGARVVAVGRDVLSLDELGRQTSGLAIQADLSDPADIDLAAQEALARYGRVDVLVNNAAVAVGDDILRIDEAAWDRNLAVVLKSVYLCSRALLPGMIERRRGAIVNIASVNGLSALGEEGYSAAKAGMINLTRNMAVKYGRFGVRANCICPGTIRTPIWQARVERDPQIFERLAKWYPLGRVGEPEDVAGAALFLASDDASWVTGATLVVDGGLLAGSYRMSRELEGEPEDE